jgi:recombinational DNA repair protein RecR
VNTKYNARKQSNKIEQMDKYYVELQKNMIDLERRVYKCEKCKKQVYTILCHILLSVPLAILKGGK